MKILLLSLLASVFLLATASATAQAIKAKTDKGREVMLYPDGTWKYSAGQEDNAIRSSATAFKKPLAATKLYKGKKGTYGVWINEKKWKLVPEADKKNSDAEFEFEHADGDAYGLIIFERIPMSLESLRDIALSNAQSVAPDASIVYQDKRQVNGVDVLCTKIEGTIETIPFVYYNYYYVGNAGTIQYITYTSQNLFKEYGADFDDLLNGFEVYVK